MKIKKQRNTKQRQLILDTVFSRKDHPTAHEIYLDVREKQPSISRGTVYRNLGVLTDNGEIQHIQIPNADRFDWRTDNHYHVICSVCGSVEDTLLPYQSLFDENLEKETGYTVSRHRTVFEGVCPKCMGTQANS